MSVDQADDDGEVGYRKPPKSSQFRKGTSGNPRGRPRGRRKKAPYEAVLGQMVTIRENGSERRVTAAEAFLLHVTKQGLEGDGVAARAAMAAIAEARNARPEVQETMRIRRIIIVSWGVNQALQALRMARKLDRARATARMAIEPWIVEMALEGLGDRRLSSEEQAVVVAATRTPWKVRWPDWWEQMQAEIEERG